MKKYIKLHHYLHNDYKGSNTTICPVLIDIDRIRVVTCSETGSVIWLDNGDNIHVLENIEAIENLLNTKQRVNMIITTKIDYLEGCFDTKKSKNALRPIKK